MENKRFLCYQQFIDDSKFVNDENIMNGMRVAIRNVGAENGEEASKKFQEKVKTSKDNKLEIVCFELDSLLTID